MNFLPVEAPTSLEVDATGKVITVLTTAHELFYKVKPDLGVLFPFGAIGYYHRPSDGGRGKWKKFENNAFTGIALGRSDNATGIMFWNTTLQRFCVSANYKLDGDRSLANAFPGRHPVRRRSECPFVLQQNPTWNPSLLERKSTLRLARNRTARCSDGRSSPDQHSDPSDRLLSSTSSRKPGDGFMREDRTYGPRPTLGVDTAHLPSGLDSDDDEDPFSPTLPDWMIVGGKVSMLVNEKRYKGTLDLDEDNDWVFTVRNRAGQIVSEHGLYGLPYSW